MNYSPTLFSFALSSLNKLLTPPMHDRFKWAIYILIKGVVRPCTHLGFSFVFFLCVSNRIIM